MQTNLFSRKFVKKGSLNAASNSVASSQDVEAAELVDTEGKGSSGSLAGLAHDEGQSLSQSTPPFNDEQVQNRVDMTTTAYQPYLTVFGWELALKPETKFVLLCSGAIVSALAFAALQENVFRLKNFHYAGLITLLTSLSYTACGFVERVCTNDLVRR
eukprot:scaffold1173_cov405-Prasinococcus_capsulatus_cf.AAC.16